MDTLRQDVPLGLRRLLNSLALAAVAILTGVAASFIAGFLILARGAAKVDPMVALRYE